MPANINNGVFCVLPWIEKFQEIDGKSYLCCHSRHELTNGIAEDIRSKIWQGVKVDACEKCYTLEDQKAVSPRLIESIRWMKDPEVKQYFSQDTAPDPKLYYLELRYDNKCNLTCIMCSPLYSNLWGKELGNENFIVNESVPLHLLHTAKKIYLSGGEPLINSRYLELFDYIIEHDIDVELVINTNLTSVSDKVFDRLQKIKNCCLNISVDAGGSVNEYHRYPMTWNKFKRNLATVKALGIKCSICTVASAVSVFGFDQLLEIDDYPLYWDFNLLTWPRALQIENIPDALKPLALERVAVLKSSKFYKKDFIFRSKVDAVLAKISQPGDEFLLSNYIQQLDTRRGINHVDYLGVNLI